MSRLVSSENALRALLLLSQRKDGLRTSEVADALGISYTGAQKALGILVADGLAKTSDRRFALADTPRAQEAIRFAMAILPADVALAALARGNEAVEFAARYDQGSLVVFRRFSEPAAEGRFRDGLTALRQFTPGFNVEIVRKEDLREQLRRDVELRRRAAGMSQLAGALALTFPDETRRGDVAARALGRLNEAIAAPSSRRLGALARQYGLRRIVAFGSATRTDFRPDSDIDLLVDTAPGRRLGLEDRVNLMADAERLFGRDVDLLAAPVRRASLAQQIARDGVVLFDSAR